MADNKHVFIINPKADNPSFKRQRGFDPTPETQDEENNEPKFIHEFKKEELRNDYAAFYTQRKSRNENRTIPGPIIDLIRIYFLCVFGDDLKKKFFERYGLSPVEYTHFNKTVMFEVIDNQLFTTFSTHIQQIVESPEGTSYENQPYNLLALVMKFEFIGTLRRLFTSNETGILLTLISSANTAYLAQKRTLLQYLSNRQANVTYIEASPDIIEVKTLTREEKVTIASNFDIVKTVTSSRALKVRPGIYGTVRREFGFTVIVPEGLTTVGIIDTGVNRIEPLQNLISETAYDHTNMGSYWDEVGHGTLVAGLVTLGDEFPAEIKESYTAKAKIAVIKAIHNQDDEINIPRLIQDIRDAKRTHGIRLFNMSLNIPLAKKYNDGYSQFAYELDKLAYEEDLLIFISVGNINGDYIERLLIEETHPDHEYPAFFYKIDSTSEFHNCRNTNISEPSESLNNISIGALAGNLEKDDNSDITPNNSYPAYYSRKFHFDYNQAVNSTPLKKNQRNKYLNKPDLVFEGGDLFSYEAGIEILRSPMAETEKYFGRTCGTSLATPLGASYAAEILNNYPSLRTQTVKALLINTATFHRRKDLPHFSTSTDSLLKSMVGFGRPQKSTLLSTDDNSILFVIEDEISIGQIITMPIHLPEYLQTSGNKLKFDISLCYSFLPLKDNHLNYLPIYMAFNIVRNLDIRTISQAEQAQYGIKRGFSWSEDHYGIENRLFSNAQSTSYTLQPADLLNVENAIAIAVRCLCKDEIPDSYKRHASNNQHRFSIVIRITEIPINEVDGRLYQEMINCNEIRNIAEVINDNDIDLDV
ncbi:Subtilase family protein [Chitinophaga jiangningensis]|uniref:Subtilase family protein n=1 Tax=Chitinophaga jiangningensis TaxID=1419482 RepID=A0A1M7EC18_9BACT|nr:S8 family peptidase [Chitinophaga jiangningensis]SHL89302.1 Subtilase family protein [Chitinophaga jiangningensis]